jgi:hypothetical protein
MKNTSEGFLKAMRIFAWIVFIWFLVKAGAIIISFGASINNPEGAKDLYRGLNLSRYYQASFIHYTIIVLYYIILYLLQAYIALFATRLLSVNTLQNLYTNTVLGIIQKIKTTALGVFIVSILHDIHVELLARYATIEADVFSIAYIFMAGMLFVMTLFLEQTLATKIQPDKA